MIPEWQRIAPEHRQTIEDRIQEVPVKIGELARALGLEVKAATLSPGVSGMIKKANTPAGYEIKINRHESPLRQRFTIAHEIAHYLLHADAIGDGIEDSILYRSPKMGDRREAEANRLAAELLMPRKMVRYYLNMLGGTIDKNTSRVLAQTFQTSEDAMSIRIGAKS